MPGFLVAIENIGSSIPSDMPTFAMNELRISDVDSRILKDLVRKQWRISSGSMKAMTHVPQRRKGSSPKTDNHWEGLHTIIRKMLRYVVYRSQKSPRCEMNVVHADWRSPYCRDV